MDAVCGVCLDTVLPEDAGALDCCTHSHHADCILTWAATETSCPLCKRRFSSVARPGQAPQLVAVATQRTVWEFAAGAEDEDEEDALAAVICCVCGDGDAEEELLLCRRYERCAQAAHTHCLGLGSVPSEDWTCSACAAPRRAGRARPPPAPVPGRLARAASEGLSATAPSDAELFIDGPPSPGRDAGSSRERRFVLRQRALAASGDAAREARRRQLAGERAVARGAAVARNTSMRTVRELRAHWDALRAGQVTFASLAPAARGGGSAPAAAHPARRGAYAAPPALAAVGTASADDAVEASWRALDGLRSEALHPARGRGRGARPAGRAGQDRRAAGRDRAEPAQAAPVGGSAPRAFAPPSRRGWASLPPTAPVHTRTRSPSPPPRAVPRAVPHGLLKRRFGA